VVDDHHQVLVPAPVRDLIDPDPAQLDATFMQEVAPERVLTDVGMVHDWPDRQLLGSCFADGPADERERRGRRTGTDTGRHAWGMGVAAVTGARLLWPVPGLAARQNS
jgi:hypothetical protein